MKTNPVILITALLFFSTAAAGQIQPAAPQIIDPALQQTMEKVSKDLTKVTKSLDTFNSRLDEFLQSLNKYKGVQLSETQQRLLFGYEILNQTEQLAATLRKSLLETAEREATLKRRLQQLDFDLRPENISRSVQTAGTTKLDEARDNQRRKLEAEWYTLQNALREVENGRDQLRENLRATESFANSSRNNLFAQIKYKMANY